MTSHHVIVPLPRTFAVPDPIRPLVAVLSFNAIGGNPALQDLGTELADAVRDRLAREPDLRTILINSEYLAKAPPHALELVCRELRVGHIVSGRCHGTREQPSLYLEVSDTREWHVRWAHFFRGDARCLLGGAEAPMDNVVRGLRRVLVHRRRTPR